MAEQGIVTACVLVIGNEILSGRTRDKNINYLARGLEALGVRLREVRVIPDDRAKIVDTVNQCRAAFDYVITTGGIGPTHDDITSECVAEAFGVGMYRDPETVELIRSYMQSGEMNEARMRMATFPDGAELISNPVSAAPGYRKDNVFVLAGVPQIMQAMFDGMKPLLVGGSRMRGARGPCASARGRDRRGARRIAGPLPGYRHRQLSRHAPAPLRGQRGAARHRRDAARPRARRRQVRAGRARRRPDGRIPRQPARPGMNWEAPVLGLMLGVGVLLGFQGFVAMTNRSLPDIARKKGMWRLNAGVTLAVVSMIAIAHVSG